MSYVRSDVARRILELPWSELSSMSGDLILGLEEAEILENGSATDEIIHKVSRTLVFWARDCIKIEEEEERARAAVAKANQAAKQ